MELDAEDERISKEIEEIRNFSLSNQLRIGFFGRDACTQTEVSELPPLCLLANTTTELVNEMETLKKDIALKVRFMEAQYESRLQQEADSLYTRINDEVKGLEKQHKEKVKVLRKCFQQQLANAMEIIRGSYKNYYLKREPVGVQAASDMGRFGDLMAEIDEKNFLIESMSEQLKEYEERTLTTLVSDGVEDPEREWLRSETERLKDAIDSMDFEMKQVRCSLEAKDQRLEVLANTVKGLNEKSEEDRKAMEKMTRNYEQLKFQSAMEKETSRKKMKEIKQERDKEFKSMEEFHQKQKLSVEKETEELLQAEKERQKRAMTLAHEAVVKAQTQASARAPESEEVLIQQLDEMKKAETVQKKQIEKLQKQVIHIDKIWQKKFEVLNNRFLATKDEMFLRHALQRQAATLHHASVVYTKDAPFHFCPEPRRPRYGPATPLPYIRAGRQQTTRGVEAQRPATSELAIKENWPERFSTQTDPAESQLESDDEDEYSDEEGILPLPRPSSRDKQTATLPPVRTPCKE